MLVQGAFWHGNGDEKKKKKKKSPLVQERETTVSHECPVVGLFVDVGGLPSSFARSVVVSICPLHVDLSIFSAILLFRLDVVV